MHDPKQDAHDRAAARASDIEQKLGHGGNPQAPRQVDEAEPVEVPVPEVGSSGYIPRAETLEESAKQGETGSPGADADRAAAERRG